MSNHTTEITSKKSRKRKRQPLEQRFWKYVNKTDTCWLWTGATRNFGYGAINAGGKYGKAESAHRVSWLIHFGEIPADLCVCHHCDNPLCVNPNHLFLGTRTDNNHDMQRKGRVSGGSKGEHHHQSKLTERQIVEIRTLFNTGSVNLSDLALRYGVTVQTIHSIVHGKTWPNAGGPISTDNMRLGARNNHSTLTQAQVLAIRQDYTNGILTQSDLAEKYNTTPQTIHRIVHRKAWKHI